MTKPKAILYARVSSQAQAGEDRYSMPQQLEALREYASREGYEVAEEVTDPGQSGVSLERPGLDRVRDLAQDGDVSVVLAQDRDRFAREPALLWLLEQELAVHGARLRALNNRGDGSPEGVLTDGILDQLAKYERAKTTERTRRGRLQRAKQGKVLPNRNPPYGFLYADGAFSVDEPKMAHVRKIFRLVGVEGKTLVAVKRTLDGDGVPTSHGAKYWDLSVIRRMLLNDIYLARPCEEVTALVAPEVAARLDSEKRYGVYWWNRQRVRRAMSGPTRYVREDNDPSEWIAIPVSDSGIPPEWVERAMAAIEDRPSRMPDAGRRLWELKGMLLCPCGRHMTTFSSRRKYKSKTYFTYAYVCSYHRRHGSGSCEHARYHKAERVEGRIRRLILDLVSCPEVMLGHVWEDVEREKERLKNTERERVAWAEELGKVERKRDALIEMRADGDITKEKFRDKVAELDARKAAAERELAALDATSERAKLLDSLPGLIEEYIRELPSLVHGREGAVRDYAYTEEQEERKRKAREEGRLPIFPISPEIFRGRTPEEMEELREKQERERGQRYRAMYELLGLKATASKDKTLEVRGTFGVRNVRLGDEPSSIWKAVTGTDAQDALPPETLAGASPEFDAGGAYPGEHHGEEEVVCRTRQKEQKRGGHPGRERVAAVALPGRIFPEPSPQEEDSGQQCENEEHEGEVVDEAGQSPGAGVLYWVGLEAHERHRRSGREE
jgi:site-specific DNA recombinase